MFPPPSLAKTSYSKFFLCLLLFDNLSVLFLKWTVQLYIILINLNSINGMDDLVIQTIGVQEFQFKQFQRAIFGKNRNCMRNHFLAPHRARELFSRTWNCREVWSWRRAWLLNRKRHGWPKQIVLCFLFFFRLCPVKQITLRHGTVCAAHASTSAFFATGFVAWRLPSHGHGGGHLFLVPYFSASSSACALRWSPLRLLHSMLSFFFLRGVPMRYSEQSPSLVKIWF